jgi:type VI secretion system secreted protein Hcp
MALLLKGPGNWPAGTSTTPGFEGWIPLSSLQWGAGRPVGVNPNNGRPQPGRLTFTDITITKQLDNTTASIARALQQTTPIDTVEVVEVADSPNVVGFYPMLSLKVFNAFFDSYSVSTGGDRPSESVSLTFTRVIGTTITVDAKGTPNIKDTWTYDALKG